MSAPGLGRVPFSHSQGQNRTLGLRPSDSGPRDAASPCPVCANTGSGSDLFDHLVGAGEQRGRDGQAERFRSPKIDH
jgi:hypothetical protein